MVEIGLMLGKSGLLTLTQYFSKVSHWMSSATFNRGICHRFWLSRDSSSRQFQRVTAACPPQLHITYNNLYVNFPNFCITQILHVKLERSRRSGWHVYIYLTVSHSPKKTRISVKKITILRILNTSIFPLW